MSALVSIRYGHTRDTCLVFKEDALPLGACKTFLKAMIMANNACHTLPERAEIWEMLAKEDG